jgi:hypothetical protein
MVASDGVQCASPASRTSPSRSSDMACSRANRIGLSQLTCPNALSWSPHLTMDRVQILVLPYMSASGLLSLSRVCVFMLGICSPR